MFSSPSKLLFGAAAATAALFDLSQAASCSGGPFAQVQAIGETNPDPNKMTEFCASRWDEGLPITGLDVWYDEGEGINAVVVKYAKPLSLL